MISEKKKITNSTTASFLGLVIISLVGLILYLLLSNIVIVTDWIPYESIIEGIMGNNIIFKFIWMIKDFSEGQFYGGLFASIGLIIGAILAWRLDVKNSRYAGINISYGLNIWPWIFTSQILTMSISIFILNYLSLLDNESYTWLPTFLLLVGAPQAVLCIYGPSIKALFTGSILGGTLTVPIANWINNYIMIPVGMPGTVANYFALASSITITLQVCSLLPWMEKKSFNTIDYGPKPTEEEMYNILKNPLWIIRRTLADLTDPLFYGNEIASLFLIIGAIIDWLLNSKHGFLGSQVFPAILFSQLLSGGVSVYLYGRKHLENGWYPTYVPVVSIAPFCVLTFGTTIPVILLSSILGAIIGAPFAELLNRNLPDHLHGVIPNVLAMGMTTMLTISVMNYLPWF
ncbi:hypothetical protein RBU61_01100 [Tissierella sp. MB52-C2]|uniref:hypothetical protein n=1 Tax=Tissierella sp. MB52-C2 TaxID=3070999 RepID=UPI00280B8064|nr:hypothetical protein [Tissierella sp. MB52-C2]WMM25289.1 hypothetical protein RBU61_01100 [Tissierella sp. MB52-C2]